MGRLIDRWLRATAGLFKELGPSKVQALEAIADPKVSTPADPDRPVTLSQAAENAGGGMTRRVVLMGHSHIMAIAHAALGKREFRTIQLLEPQFDPVLSQGTINQKLIDVLNSEPFDAIALTLGGNEHVVLGLVEHPQPFDFTLVGDEGPDNLASARQQVPVELVRRAIGRMLIYSEEFLIRLRAITDTPIYLLESPPPIGRDEHLLEYGGVFIKEMQDRGITPARIRYKLWKLQTELYEEMATAAGVTYLRVPPEARDADGMLAERAWNLDATHANPWYGSLVLEQLT